MMITGQKKRQSVRKAITFTTFLLYPIIMFYFSPYVIIEAALEGYASASFVIFILLFVSSLFLGRAWCGWLCPGTGMQNSLIGLKVVTKPIKKGAWIKFLVWAPWLLFILFAFCMSGGIKGIDFFFQIRSGISVDEAWKYIIYYIGITAILGLNLIFGKRAFCKYLCWVSPFMIIGRKIRNFLRYPSLGLKADKSKCKNCMQCNETCPMSIDVNKQVQRNSIEHYECTLCGSCVDNCPNKVLSFSFRRYCR
jgi:ferredoxin-type protein NapH